jgi:hypothetical protein
VFRNIASIVMVGLLTYGLVQSGMGVFESAVISLLAAILLSLLEIAEKLNKKFPDEIKTEF